MILCKSREGNEQSYLVGGLFSLRQMYLLSGHRAFSTCLSRLCEIGVNVVALALT